MQGDGDAIYVIHFSVVYISGYVKFVNNQANGRGGAIALEKNVMINIIGNANVSFINNTSSSGGAISTYFGNMSIVNSSVTFINNVATKWGGAVHFFNSDLFVRMLVDLRFINNTAATQGGALMMADGTFTIDDYSQLFLFKNHAVQSGDVFMYSSYMEFSLNVTARFVNNTATDVGGAVYALAQPSFPCFYYITVGDTQLSTVEFNGNSASSKVGNHIYGGSMKSMRCSFELVDLYSFLAGGPLCQLQQSYLQFNITPHSFSSVSSEPQRVCLCDSNGTPQCTSLPAIFVEGESIYPGNTVTVTLVIVGLDFGTTTGRVNANFLHLNDNKTLLNPNQWSQLVKNVTECSQLKYTVYSKRQHEVLYLQTSKTQLNTYGNVSAMSNSIEVYQTSTCIDDNLLTTPVFINVTILPCPPEFYLSNSHRCECYSILSSYGFDCQNIGYIS